MTDVHSGPDRPRVLFITTTPALHKSGAFRLLQESTNVLFIFFSRGREPYKSASATPNFAGLRYRDIGTLASSRIAVLAALLKMVAVSDYDVMVKCVNGKLELAACYLACLLRRKSFILWTGIWKWPDNIPHRIGRPLVRRICRRADAVCTYGPHVSRFLEEEGVHCDKLFDVLQPVEPDRQFDSSNRVSYLGSGRLRILFVGRLVEQKGIFTLLAAAAAMSQSVTLTVAGEGTERAKLESVAASAGLDVAWVGEQTPSGLARLYRASDCVVIPSITTPMVRETWSFVANEAMLSGCVVVGSTAVGAVSGGLVRHGETGLVFEEGDSAALRDRLQQLLVDPTLCEDLARAGEEEARTYTEAQACAGFRAAIASVQSRSDKPLLPLQHDS